MIEWGRGVAGEGWGWELLSSKKETAKKQEQSPQISHPGNHFAFSPPAKKKERKEATSDGSKT